MPNSSVKYNGYKRLLWGEVMRVVGGIWVGDGIELWGTGKVWLDGEGVVLEPIVSKTAIGWRRGVEEEEVYMICEGHEVLHYGHIMAM